MDLNAIISRINRFGLECFGHYYSSYPGYVTENEDPKQLQRVQVIVPSILGTDSTPIWAFRKGSSPRFQDLPQIGDMVWVEFLNGRLESATWSHFYPLKAEVISEFKHPFCYGYKSPAGYLILIDEKEKTFLIQTPEGLYRKFTEDSIIDKADKIFLTDPEADKKVPLGQDMDSDIKDALNNVKTLLEKLLLFANSQSAATGPASGPLVPLNAAYTLLGTEVLQIISNLETSISKFTDDSHLSGKVKLT